jgi:hypothetical protein
MEVESVVTDCDCNVVVADGNVTVMMSKQPTIWSRPGDDTTVCVASHNECVINRRTYRQCQEVTNELFLLPLLLPLLRLF